MTTSNFLIMQDSHTSLQEGLRTDLSSGLSSEIAFTSSQDTASGIMGTFVKGMATIFQTTESTKWPTESVLGGSFRDLNSGLPGIDCENIRGKALVNG